MVRNNCNSLTGFDSKQLVSAIDKTQKPWFLPFRCLHRKPQQRSTAVQVEALADVGPVGIHRTEVNA